MVRLSSVFTTISLGLLASSADAFKPIFKRYENSTSCEVVTETTTSVVDVYGPAYSGPVSNKYSQPVIEASWENEGPVFTVVIPQQILNLVGLDLALQSAANVEYEDSDYTLYSGDIDNFVYPGKIYSTSANGLIFNGRTQAPLLKIVAAGKADDSAPYFMVIFELEIDTINTAAIAKRDTTVYTLTGSIENPAFTSTSSSSSSSSSSSTSTSTGSTSSGETTTSVSSTGSGESSTSSSTTSAGESTTSSSTTSAGESTTSSSTTSAGESTTSSSSSAADSSVGPISTVVVGSTTTQTITSCSDHKCSEHKVTAVGSVIVTTINDIVTSYSTYCPISVTQPTGVDEPTAKTIYPVEKTVTVGDFVTVVTTFCPESETAISATITKPNGEQTAITITDFSTVTLGSSTSTAQHTGLTTPTTGVVDVTTTAPGTGAPATVTQGKTTYVPVEQSSSTAAGDETISLYEAAAAGKSGYLSGGIVGIIGLFMML